MKKLFESHIGENAVIFLEENWKIDAKVAKVFDDYIMLETTYSGPEQCSYVPFAAVKRVHFKTPVQKVS
jgi:hypothetical protein